MSLSANEAWFNAVHKCFYYPEHCPRPRALHNRELLGHLMKIDLTRPVVTLVKRKLGYRFLCAEAAHILSGDDRVATIAPYSKTIHHYSDDGVTFFGAYGPKIQQQLPYVLQSLRRDRASRQAVLNIWRESPPKTKDPPCTLSCQFVIRDDCLNAFVNMRSSDVWLGVPYDVFNFAMLAGVVLLELGDANLKLGALYQYAGSRHLYERDWPAAQQLLEASREELFDCAPFAPLTQFANSRDLIAHLWALARRDSSAVRSTWLTELLSLPSKPTEVHG